MNLRLTQSEENYLKSIYRLSSESEKDQVPTNAIAEDLNTKASSVTEMIKKLSGKLLIDYTKYQGSALTTLGNLCAIKVIRKHRLWETFLVEKLNFTWDEVHDIAEQLEHIQSEKLTNSLSQFLGNPEFDPHGDPIPDIEGRFPSHESARKLKELEVDEIGIVYHISLDNKTFLQYLTENKVSIGSHIQCKAKFSFDDSMTVVVDGKQEINFSKKVIKNIIVK
ncbi:MAG: metal-dependent transcriptional regulator [Crocinitomicaceae bacterium]